MRVNKPETFLLRTGFFLFLFLFLFVFCVHTVLLCRRHRPLCPTSVFGGNCSNCAPWRHGNGNLHFPHCWDPNRTSCRPQVGVASVWQHQQPRAGGACKSPNHAQSLYGVLFNRELLGREEHWPILLSTTGVPAILQLITLLWFPESPRYLFIDRKDEDGCKKGNNLCWQVMELHCFFLIED